MMSSYDAFYGLSEWPSPWKPHSSCNRSLLYLTKDSKLSSQSLEEIHKAVQNLKAVLAPQKKRGNPNFRAS